MAYCDNIYPLHLGNSIHPSARLSAWGFPKSAQEIEPEPEEEEKQDEQ